MVSQLKQGLADAKRVNRQVSPINEIDNFKKLMSKFLSRASDEVEALEDLFDKTEKKYTELAAFYAEDPGKLPAEEFFKIVFIFITHVREGYKMLSALRKAEEAKARIEAKRAERIAEMAEEKEDLDVPISAKKSGSKSPRPGRSDAQIAVAGIDLDALMGGKSDDKPKPKKTGRRVGKEDAAAALQGLDLEKMMK